MKLRTGQHAMTAPDAVIQGENPAGGARTAEIMFHPVDAASREKGQAGGFTDLHQWVEERFP